MAAMDVLETKQCIEKSKLGFFIRLLNNEFTKKLIEDEWELKFLGSYVCEIAKICEIDLENSTLDKLIGAVSDKLKSIVRNDTKDSEVIEIKSLLNNYNDSNRIRLFNIIKF